MKPIYLILVLLFVAECLDPSPLAAAQAAKSDHELLQGTWVCVSTLKDGKVVNSYVGVRAVIDGDSITWYMPQKDGSVRKGVGKFRIDPSKKQFDWWLPHQPDKIDRRLYTINDKVLGWSTNLDYLTRPEAFRSGRWVYAMQRAEPPKERAARTTIPGWGTVIDPDGDCTIGPTNGTLSISVPGTSHDLFYGGPDVKRRFNAPRVLRAVDGDFIARVKVTGDWRLTPEKSSYNGAGLVVWDSENQYLRLERNRYYRGSEPRGPHSYITPLYDHNQNRAQFKTASNDFFPGRSTWLQIERTGNQITTSVSAD